MTHRDPYVETELVRVLNAVFAAPGIWTARLCRQVNGLSETEASGNFACAAVAGRSRFAVSSTSCTSWKTRP